MSIENSCVRLDEGRWNPKNREVLEKLIEKYRNTNSYAVFDWDNTSIQGDTQLNLFIYQIENLVYKLNPLKFNEVIRKNIPTTDLFTLQESPRLGAGLMEMKETTFPWTLTYDELDYIIEGRLEILIDGRKVVGEAGDVILIPKNSKIEFSAPNYAKFLYFVYPANWSEL